MTSVIDVHQPYALVSIGNQQPLYITCACHREIDRANLRLSSSGLQLRYIPVRHPPDTPEKQALTKD